MTLQIQRYSNRFISSLIRHTEVKFLLSLFCTFVCHLVYYQHMKTSFLQLGIPMLGVSFLCGFFICYKLFSISNRYLQYAIVLPVMSISLGYQYAWMCRAWIPKDTSHLQILVMLSVLFYVMMIGARNRFLLILLQSMLSFACAFSMAWCIPLLLLLPNEVLQYAQNGIPYLSYQGLWLFGFFLFCYVGMFHRTFSFSTALLVLGILLLTLYQLDSHEMKSTYFWNDIMRNLHSGGIVVGIFACFLSVLSYRKMKDKKKAS